MELSNRNIATQELLKYFAYAHLPEQLRAISEPCCALALRMCEALPDSRELTVGLRKLLEAKDCFVRARLPELPAPWPR